MQHVDLADGVVVLTGATSGIGRAATELLVDRGATVAAVGRDRERAEDLRASVADAPGRVAFHRADLADLAAVRDLAADLRAEYDDLHALVHNAGIAAATREESADGIELTLAVNHVAPYLLTHELVELLVASAPSRVVVTASGVHHRVPREDVEEDLQLAGTYDGLAAYSRSKFANVAFTLELADRLEETGVVANCLHPGFVRGTRIWKGTSFRARVLTRVASLVPGVGTSVETAGRRLARLVTDPEFGDRTGCYVDEDAVGESSAVARDPTFREWLWTETAAMADVDPDWPAGGT